MRVRLLLALALTLCVAAEAQSASVSGTVTISQHGKGVQDRSGAVVWLTPIARSVESARPTHVYRLTQKDKHFDPHLLVVPQNSQVEFPNRDPFFHNVFSLHDGVRFDLGLYEHGTSKTVTFSKPGASFIFCNIHPEMSAVVMVMNSPYYATTDEKGAFSIADVPPGDYQLSIWYERAMENQLRSLSRKLTIGTSPVTIGSLKIDQTAGAAEHHKNKFGMDYEAQPPYKIP
jgi:plastocyanin